MLDVNLELLTDEAIIDYSTDESGRPNILTDHRDFNLKNIKQMRPIDGGVYDRTIFGSPMIDQCICGKIRKPSDHPCPNCGCRVYSIEEGLRRFGRIELPFYYLPDLRFDIFKEFIEDTFNGCEVEMKFVMGDLVSGGYSTSRRSKAMTLKNLNQKVFDSCQFDFDKKANKLTISEEIDSVEKSSYEGILKILEENFPGRVLEMKKYINHLYLVLPSVMRPFTYGYQNGKRIMGVHKMSTWYGVVLNLCCVANVESRANYETVVNSFKTPGEKVRYTALLRALLNAGKRETTELLKQSRDNLARTLYGVRTRNSMRCPIVPDVNLKIDEISVPRHLAFEMCRSGFCKYLEDELNFTHDQAVLSTREEYDDPKVQELFKEYAEKQVVINKIVTSFKRRLDYFV